MKHKDKTPDLTEVSSTRKFRLGTRYVTPKRNVWKYGKIDFGILGHDETGKIIRNIQYRWIPVEMRM